MLEKISVNQTPFHFQSQTTTTTNNNNKIMRLACTWVLKYLGLIVHYFFFLHHSYSYLLCVCRVLIVTKLYYCLKVVIISSSLSDWKKYIQLLTLLLYTLVDRVCESMWVGVSVHVHRQLTHSFTIV